MIKLMIAGADGYINYFYQTLSAAQNVNYL